MDHARGLVVGQFGFPFSRGRTLGGVVARGPVGTLTCTLKSLFDRWIARAEGLCDFKFGYRVRVALLVIGDPSEVQVRVEGPREDLDGLSEMCDALLGAADLQEYHAQIVVN
jgi:hypothetical protein